MEQIKIGEFIAAQRKLNSLTQAALAEKLGITDRAVSKWERGKGLPDASLMLDLCEILGITVNELLCGEKLKMENNDMKTEELLIEMAKIAEQKDRTIWSAMWWIMVVSITSMFAGIFFAKYLIPEGMRQLIAILSIAVFFMIPCFFALRLEVNVGYYQCKNCGHKIVPTYKAVLMAPHFGTTRRLECPECGKKTYCKKVITKK